MDHPILLFFNCVELSSNNNVPFVIFELVESFFVIGNVINKPGVRVVDVNSIKILVD